MAIFVQETGSSDGSTILFLHGLITSGWMWQQQAQSLEGFHCLIPDLPGHGHSRHIPWISIEDTAQQVANLIAERHARVHLVGLSLGSLIAIQVMHLIPERVGRVIVSGTNLLPLPLRMQVMTVVMLPFLKTEFFIQRASRGLRLPPVATDLYRQSMRAISSGTILKITQQATTFRLPASLRFAQIPVLVVAGEQENPLIHQTTQILLTILPCAQGYLAPMGRHGWVGETPDLFAQMAQAWFTESPLPPRLIPVEK